MPTITASETLDGAAINDSLLGGGTGLDLGSVITGSYGPVIDKNLNQGEQNLYLRHDHTSEILDVGGFRDQYGINTGFAYGGAESAVADFATMKALGVASGSSKNNTNFLSGGYWIDMDWDGNASTRFDQANFPSLVKIHGDHGTDGQSLVTAFTLQTDAMVYDSGGETAAIAPVSGQIGEAANAYLGTNAHINSRLYIPNSFTDSGVLQFEWVIKFSFVA